MVRAISSTSLSMLLLDRFTRALLALVLVVGISLKVQAFGLYELATMVLGVVLGSS